MRNLGDAMKQWIVIVAALLIETQAHAQSEASSGRVYLPSCLAAANIVQGKHPAADSEDAAKQLKQAAICFGGRRGRHGAPCLGSDAEGIRPLPCPAQVSAG